MKWVLVALSFVPVSLFAYLGHFSRLISDDYRYLARSREMGVWQNILYWRDTWTGSYGRSLFFDFAARIDTAGPAVFAVTTILVWTAGLSWLLYIALSWLRLSRRHQALAFPISALTVAAAINAFFTPASYYWLAASQAYVMPLAMFTVFLALLAQYVGKQRRIWTVGAATLGFALATFVSAGFSEFYLVFQLCIMTFLLALTLGRASRLNHRACQTPIAAGWLATLASLFIQISAPGTSIRSALISSSISTPVRDPFSLAIAIADGTFQAVGRQEVFAGFALLFAAGLGTALLSQIWTTRDSVRTSFKLARGPHWIGLVAQLLFVPILWTHRSDSPQILGQFSLAFSIVIAINLALLAAFLILIWQQTRISDALQERQDGVLIYAAIALLLALSSFSVTQVRSIHFKAATFLYVVSFVQLLILALQLQQRITDSTSRKLSFSAAATSTLTIVVIAIMIGVSLFGAGHVQARSMASVAFMQVAQGLVWGAYIGYLIGRRPYTVSGIRLVYRIGLSAVATVVFIGSGITFGHGRLVSDLRTYAREWDARHQLILTLRDSGQKDIVVSPLSFELAEYLDEPNLASGFANSRALMYYGVNSIAYEDIES